MKLADYLSMETLDVALFSARNPLRAGADSVRELLEALTVGAPSIAPQVATVGSKTARFSPDSVLALLKGKEARPKTILNLSREQAPEVTYTLNFVQPGWDVEFWLRLFVPVAFIIEPDHAESRAREIAEVVRRIDAICPLVYGYAHTKGDLSLGADPMGDDPSAVKKVYQAYWLNVYGATMVEWLGRKTVNDTPCHSIENLASGAVMLLTRATPADVLSPVAREAQAKAFVHLRENVDAASVLSQLQDRSAKLAPVTRDWDVDIADVLSMILDVGGFAAREETTRRFNAYRPPEVSERRPASALLQTDVDDVTATVIAYEELHAQLLIALLHRDQPTLPPNDPESLPQIDFYFWIEDFPASVPRADVDRILVRALGAFLGALMVHHLDGRWVPRNALDEVQVVVGDCAWLPFLRARHYLQTRQSVLDYSLTQFFRLAERERNQ